MTHSMLIHNSKVRSGLCIALVLAILVGIVYPCLSLEQAALADPLQNVEVQEITTLHLGDNKGSAGGYGSEEGEETEPPETTEPPPETTVPPETTEPPPETTVPPETTEPPPETTVPPETTEPPETTVPTETTEPEETEPETTEPEESTPGESEPEESTPDESEPEESVPGESEPEESIPGESEPEESTPGESEPEESIPGESEPEESVPGESEPEESIPGESEPEESVPGESEPEESIPEESEPEVTTPGPGGDEGDEETELDLALVLNWYKYGSQRKTIVCPPSEAVTKTINYAQLEGGQLKYDFTFTGDDAQNADVTSVQVAEGNGSYRTVAENGEITIIIPDGSDYRNYTFRITAEVETRDAGGNRVTQELTFQFVLRFENGVDLDLELRWDKTDGSTATITCAPDATVSRTVESNQLREQVFSYSPRLTGGMAADARIVSGEYTTGSGGSGVLNTGGGSLIFAPAEGSDTETYYLVFEAKIQGTDTDGDRYEQTVYFHITITYRQVLDVQLSFVWFEKGTTRRTLTCQPGQRVSTGVKNNQLSAGAVKYEMSLTGASAENGRILSASYESSAGSGTLSDPASGSIPMTMPAGSTSNTYLITVVALVNGERITFEVSLRYTSDASLRMTYMVVENGASVQRSVVCENGRTKTAEEIYDDQLTDGMLSYTMSLEGEDTENIRITSVTCYQSGSGRTVNLSSSNQIQLLLEGGDLRREYLHSQCGGWGRKHLPVQNQHSLQTQGSESGEDYHQPDRRNECDQ